MSPRLALKPAAHGQSSGLRVEGSERRVHRSSFIVHHSPFPIPHSPFSRPQPLAPSPCRSGFTLVELLVVITIIGILAGLASVAAFKVFTSAKHAAIKTDITNLEQALEQYKLDHTDYPPSYMNLSDPVAVEKVRRHLLKAFPKCNAVAEISVLVKPDNTTPLNLTGADALVFWLTSISKDPARPLSSLDTERKSYVDFDKGRLKAPDTTYPPGWRTQPGAGGTTVARYNPHTYAPSGTPDAPFFYLEARCYREHHKAGMAYGSAGYCLPYFWSDAYDTNKNNVLDQVEWDKKPPTNDMSESELQNICANPKSFQIISAGLDGNYGSGGELKDFTMDGRDYTIAMKTYPTGRGYSDDDNDNVTNFSRSGTLGDDKPD